MQESVLFRAGAAAALASGSLIVFAVTQGPSEEQRTNSSLAKTEHHPAFSPQASSDGSLAWIRPLAKGYNGLRGHS